jgi:hypothetical protein
MARPRRASSAHSLGAARCTAAAHYAIHYGRVMPPPDVADAAYLAARRARPLRSASSLKRTGDDDAAAAVRVRVEAQRAEAAAAAERAAAAAVAARARARGRGGVGAGAAVAPRTSAGAAAAPRSATAAPPRGCGEPWAGVAQAREYTRALARAPPACLASAGVTRNAHHSPLTEPCAADAVPTRIAGLVRRAGRRRALPAAPRRRRRRAEVRPERAPLQLHTRRRQPYLPLRACAPSCSVSRSRLTLALPQQRRAAAAAARPQRRRTSARFAASRSRRLVFAAPRASPRPLAAAASAPCAPRALARLLLRQLLRRRRHAARRGARAAGARVRRRRASGGRRGGAAAAAAHGKRVRRARECIVVPIDDIMNSCC